MVRSPKQNRRLSGLPLLLRQAAAGIAPENRSPPRLPRSLPQIRPRRSNRTGAVHSAEIEYALGNLPTNRVYDWQPEDYTVSAIMQAYFANFIITGDPNGTGLPTWDPLNHDGTGKVMVIDVNTHPRISKPTTATIGSTSSIRQRINKLIRPLS